MALDTGAWGLPVGAYVRRARDGAGQYAGGGRPARRGVPVTPPDDAAQARSMILGPPRNVAQDMWDFSMASGDLALGPISRALAEEAAYAAAPAPAPAAFGWGGSLRGRAAPPPPQAPAATPDFAQGGTAAWRDPYPVPAEAPAAPPPPSRPIEVLPGLGGYLPPEFVEPPEPGDPTYEGFQSEARVYRAFDHGVHWLFDPIPLPEGQSEPVGIVEKAGIDTARGLLTLPQDVEEQLGAEPGDIADTLRVLRGERDRLVARIEHGRWPPGVPVEVVQRALDDLEERIAAEEMRLGPATLQDAEPPSTAQQIGAWGEEVFAPVSTGTRAGDIAADLLRFIGPGVGAAKGVATLARGAPRAARAAGEMLAAGSADSAVSTAQDSTLGDLLGGPTSTAGRDGLGRRGSFFLEAALGTGIIETLLAAARAGRAGQSATARAGAAARPPAAAPPPPAAAGAIHAAVAPAPALPRPPRVEVLPPAAEAAAAGSVPHAGAVPSPPPPRSPPPRRARAAGGSDEDGRLAGLLAVLPPGSRDGYRFAFEGGGYMRDYLAGRLPGELLTRPDAFALFVRTEEGMQFFNALPMNAALRSGNARALQRLRPLILAQRQALVRLPPFTGTVERFVRGTGLDLSTYVPGRPVTDAGFVSASGPGGVNPFRGRDVQMIIEATGARGRSIGRYSAYPEQNEVLFPPGTPMVVLEVTRPPGRVVIRMREGKP
jgi:hypothetical protein